MRRCILAAVLLLSAFCATPAALDSAFTYQGRLRDGGSAATGLFDFQFCLYDAPANPIPIACAPDQGDVPVDQGLFAVTLNFGFVAFTGQERYLEIRVRPGSSTGGYTSLAPRQLVRAAPESLHAMQAAAVPWLGVSGVPTGIADGVDNVGVTQVAAGAGLDGGTITTSGTLSIASGGVTGAMIAADAVGTNQLAAGAVGASDIATGAVGTAALADAGVTRVKLADDAVGAAAVDPAAVQLRVTGTCPAGEYLRGINQDGTVLCDAVAVPVTRRLDTLAPFSITASSDYTALALRPDGTPIVAYYDNANLDLKIYVCNNPACSSGTPRTLDFNGSVGNWVSLVIRQDGRPGIAYTDSGAQDLRFFDCVDADCTGGTVRSLDFANNVGNHNSMTLRADGRPVIAYYDQTAGDMKVYSCGDVGCSANGVARTPLSTPAFFGLATSIVMRPSGFPTVTFFDASGGDYYIANCVDDVCSSFSTNYYVVEPGATVDGTSYTSLGLRSDNRPILVYYFQPSADLVVIDCTNVLCSTRTARILDGANGVGESPSLAVRSDDRAIISYFDRTASALKVYRCANAACSDGGAVVIDDLGSVGQFTSLALRPDGRPVIAYWDSSNGALKLHICANTECER